MSEGGPLRGLTKTITKTIKIDRKMKKKNQKQKFKPLSEATPEELAKAFAMAGLWITGEMLGLTDEGAFSEAFLGEPAVEYFPKRAYLKLKDPNCKWKWKEGTKLSTLMINIIKSDMGHALERFEAQGMPNVKAGSEFEHEEAEDGWDDANDILEVDPDLRRNDFDAPTEEERLAELRKWETQRDAGIKIARAAAQGDALMAQYVELAFTLPDHRAISKKMRKTKAEVLEIEAELIARIKVILCK